MATGDDALAAGMTIVAGTTPANTIDTEINKTRDYIAQRTSTVTPITKGGTGATTAALARTSLGITIANLGITATTVPSSSSNVQGDLNYLSSAKRDTTNGTFGSVVLSSTGSYGTSATGTGSYRAAYLASNGTLGYVPSARRMKKNIKPADAAQLQRLLEAQVVEYDYKTDFGGSHDIGLIADDLEALGLAEFCLHDEDGEVAGIAYERLAVPLLSIVQDLARRVAALEDR